MKSAEPLKRASGKEKRQASSQALAARAAFAFARIIASVGFLRFFPQSSPPLSHEFAHEDDGVAEKLRACGRTRMLAKKEGLERETGRRSLPFLQFQRHLRGGIIGP